jgi:6-phosphogluconolactonase (cycloisomerase 2 family)
LDFHPSQPWVFVSRERENVLSVFEMRAGSLGAAPLFSRSTLASPGDGRSPQAASGIHVHPGGQFVYVMNRATGTAEFKGRQVFAGGENTIAVFAVDPATGKPERIQNVDTRGFAARTFSIDPSGRILVVANLIKFPVRTGAGIEEVPASLAVFRIADGRLTYVRKYDVDVGADSIFWNGIVALS